VLTQIPPHSVWPEGQVVGGSEEMQLPFRHRLPLPHALLHWPQCLLLVAVSTQLPRQQTPPPLWHWAPSGRTLVVHLPLAVQAAVLHCWDGGGHWDALAHRHVPFRRQALEQHWRSLVQARPAWRQP
jgi:hypothetical protein